MVRRPLPYLPFSHSRPRRAFCLCLAFLGGLGLIGLIGFGLQISPYTCNFRTHALAMLFFSLAFFGGLGFIGLIRFGAQTPSPTCHFRTHALAVRFFMSCIFWGLGLRAYRVWFADFSPTCHFRTHALAVLFLRLAFLWGLGFIGLIRRPLPYLPFSHSRPRCAFYVLHFLGFRA